ncbi:MAG: hypothetical protein IKE21_08245 [Erysipelotrichaceae bacterium]|nr:hypothetical protein [Erysipelotrichaceae bacterium]
MNTVIASLQSVNQYAKYAYLLVILILLAFVIALLVTLAKTLKGLQPELEQINGISQRATAVSEGYSDLFNKTKKSVGSLIKVGSVLLFAKYVLEDYRRSEKRSLSVSVNRAMKDTRYLNSFKGKKKK